MTQSRRQFLEACGVTTAATLPFLAGVPSLQAKPASRPGKQRVIFVFSPNGTIPGEFWPEQMGPDFQCKRILKPLEAFQDQMLVLKGVYNKIGGDGDRHMRGMSCLLTATELFPGNVQGGSDSPAGWASGISIDQEIKNALQKNPETRTRFGSLHLGVEVPNRADPWTRMSYAGPNQPIAPVSDPRQVFSKLYGSVEDRESVVSVLDNVQDDLKRVSQRLGQEDRELLDRHLTLVRSLEQRLQVAEKGSDLAFAPPKMDPHLELINDNTPEISRVQIDLMINALSNDLSRVATLQYMRSVGQARMSWLGIQQGHHGLSHEPDKNKDAYEKLIRINEWFAGEIAYLTQRLADTPEPGAEGSMLDHSLIVWINELGKGNSHSLDNIPFVLIGGKAHGLQMGRSLHFDQVPHNRLWLSIAHSMGHRIPSFGTEKYCQAGPLALS